MQKKQHATMKDVAEACGCSLSTVSLVLNNNPRISEQTRSKVLSAVSRFGYQPDIHARGLAMQSSQTLSVVVPQMDHVFADVYFGEIVSGIYDRAVEEKFKILLDVSNARFIESEEYMNLLKARRADGMLFIASSLYDTFLRVFEEDQYPFILVNHYFPDSKLNYIAADYEETARLAADHLLGLGHRTIGLVTGTNVQTALQFRQTFEETCGKAGLGADDLPWSDGDFHEEGGFKRASELLARNPNITAIMAGNDKMAIGALRYIQTQGLRVPEDISIMGVDDIPAAEFTNPGLTTVHHNLYDMGRLACERILELARGKREACQDMLPVELKVRESTGPAKSG